jgi:ketosteroid isomerase-like protein
MRLHARAATTGTAVEQPLAAVWTMRSRKAVRARYYEDRAEALAAAGRSQ